MAEVKLPDLVNTDTLPQFVKQDELLAVLNQEPPQSFVKEHPMAKGVLYMPIDKVEWLLTKIYQDWYVEVLREGQMLNSIYVAIRLHYRNPVTSMWHYQDGLGAVPIQTDKGYSAADLAHIKNDAITKALPAAKSFAVKDAADQLGKLFGKDLNRKNAIEFVPSYATDDVKQDLEAKKAAIREANHAGN